MAKVSVIIPVYNDGQYLEQCIRSVLAQTLKELEVICVDDGSTDSSARTAERLAEEDARVMLLRQENRGAGAARNLALEKARGKYVSFLDADDFYLDADALERMCGLCEEISVPACASLRKLIKNGEAECDRTFMGMEKGRALDYMDFQIDYNYTDFIFLREHLEENRIRFPDYRRFQDPPFLARALFSARRFAVADAYLYAYRIAPVSARFNPASARDLLRGLIDNMEFAAEHGLDVLFANTARRLEIEYKHVFFRNLSGGGTDMLKLLIRANEIICGRKGDPDYVIKPLRGLAKNLYRYEKGLLERIGREGEIVIYGAGQFGRTFLDYLERNRLAGKVAAFAVSDLKGNRARIGGVPVVPLRELGKGRGARIFVAVREDFHGEVAEFLDGSGYGNYEFIDDDFYSMVLEE